jgi:uncharacterized protein (DUF924 family)
MSDASAQTDWTDVIRFWFEEVSPEDWFRRSDALDARIASRFSSVHRAAAAGELWAWRCTADGALAEIILLDQFSRHLFRDDARAFATDGMALVLAQQAIDRALDRELAPERKSFLYMPFMHSESGAMHEIAVKLFSQPGLERNLDFELRHQAIIARFGRFPHRNRVLGRASTAPELEFLKEFKGF